MKLIAVSGGIASGKSTIAKHLESLGAKRIDADVLAREAVAVGSSGLRAIESRFGKGVLDANGALNREALGNIVFRDAAALAALNAIVHPEVRRLANETIASIRASDSNAVVIYDVPLLVEANVEMPWDLVVIAHAPAEERLKRLVQIRNMPADEAERRIANQASDEERLAIADVVIDSGQSLQHTLDQADRLWASITEE